MKSLICPDHKAKDAYSKALMNLTEYIDITNIIKRLQDIDKLKMVLFNNKQRKIFECIPKPGVCGIKGQNTQISRFWTIDVIQKCKKKPDSKQNIRNEDVNSQDPVNKRMLDILNLDGRFTKDFLVKAGII